MNFRAHTNLFILYAYTCSPNVTALQTDCSCQVSWRNSSAAVMVEVQINLSRHNLCKNLHCIFTLPHHRL